MQHKFPVVFAAGRPRVHPRGTRRCQGIGVRMFETVRVEPQMILRDPETDSEQPRSKGPVRIVGAKSPFHLQEHVLTDVLQIRGSNSQAAEGLQHITRMLSIDLLENQSRTRRLCLGCTHAFVHQPSESIPDPGPHFSIEIG
jgi:hypothetical protein